MTNFSNVEVGAEHVELLRLFLTEDDGEPGAYDEPTGESDVIAHNLMAYSAFAVAVLRRFSPTYTIPEVIRYVTDLRKAVVGEDVLQVNPRVAESMIRAVLQDETLADREPYGADEETMVRTSFVVLLDLFHTAELDGPGLDEYLRESADYARRWLAGQLARQEREQAAAR